MDAFIKIWPGKVTQRRIEDYAGDLYPAAGRDRFKKKNCSIY